MHDSFIVCRLRNARAEVNRARMALLAGTALSVALAACTAAPSPKRTTPTVVRTTSTTAPEITTPTLTINGQTVQVPTESGSTPIRQVNDSGQHIIITSKGALPQQLFSAVSTPVVWTNLTDRTLTLTLVAVGVAPQQLAPGASYSWSPNVLDFGYAASNGAKGSVNVGTFGQ